MATRELSDDNDTDQPEKSPADSPSVTLPSHGAEGRGGGGSPRCKGLLQAIAAARLAGEGGAGGGYHCGQWQQMKMSPWHPAPSAASNLRVMPEW